MALGSNMRIGKKIKKASTPAIAKELQHSNSKVSKPLTPVITMSEEVVKQTDKVILELDEVGDQNITCQIESIGISPKSETHITLGGQLTIHYLGKIIDPIRSAVKEHNSVKVVLADIVELDLSCLQLLRAIQIGCKKENMAFVIDANLSDEQEALINCSGFLEIFKKHTAPNG